MVCANGEWIVEFVCLVVLGLMEQLSRVTKAVVYL